MEKVKEIWIGVTLEQAVHRLLESGKRSKDPEFQALFQAFGFKKVNGYAQAWLKKNQRKSSKP